MKSDKYEVSFMYANRRIIITARHDDEDETVCYNDFIRAEAERLGMIPKVATVGELVKPFENIGC